MNPAKLFKYENRLAKTVVARSGMTATQATRAAQQQIELVRQPTIDYIDAAIANIFALRDTMKAGADPAALSQMYDAANRIVATAGVFDLNELGEAAYCLCELVSRFQSSGKFSIQLIDVNAEGLRLLRDPASHTAEHRQAVLVGLNRVAASVT
ncbi:MAG: cheE protein [Caulobacteraceae bacterium]|nr:cheE protein [Caulobacteraceae bacterium]